MTSPFLLVGVGGVGGAITRHFVGARIEAHNADTFAVNVLGSLLLGMIVAAPISDAVALAAGTGFCGAFTTFSSFAFETIRLYETGNRRRALLNATVNLAGALTAVSAGSLLVSLV
jgi:CrcB protein